MTIGPMPSGLKIIRRVGILIATLSLLLVGLPQAASAASAPYRTVTFMENDSGADLTSASQTANAPTALTPIANLNPSLTNAGHAFDEWNTSPDGSGTSFADDSLYGFGSAITLYAIWTGAFHIVTFQENDSEADSIISSQFEDVPCALTNFAQLTPQFSNAGFTFVDWNLAPDGTGTAYANASVFSFSQSVSLYAIWQALPNFTQSFEANGGAGSVQSLTSQSGDTTTLPTSSGLTNPGYTFFGWNTAASGGGTEYSGGASYVFAQSQVLYAQWTPDVLIVTYNYDGGAAMSNSATFNVGSPALLLPDSSYFGFTFSGWYTSATGGVLVGLPSASYIPTISTTLYAQWTSTSIGAVTFNANGGSGTIAQITGAFGSVINLPAVTGFSNSGHSFSGWNTAADGSGIQNAGGATYVIDNSLTLYAQWILGPSETLSFNANGASGSVASIVGGTGSIITLPDQTGFIMNGYLLSRWNTNPRGTGKSYSIGQSLTLTESLVLYAQWTGHEPVTLFGAVGSFKKNSAALSLPLENQIQRIADTVKAKRYLTVTLYGYTASTGLASLNMSLSRARALHVANYLRSRLTALQVKHVSIRSAGEGAIAGESSSTYSRVEVFGV